MNDKEEEPAKAETSCSNWTRRERAFCCGYARHVTLTVALIARAWAAASGLGLSLKMPDMLQRSAFDFSQISLSKMNGWLLTTATATKRCLIAAAKVLPALYLCKNSLWMPRSGSKNRTDFCLLAELGLGLGILAIC